MRRAILLVAACLPLITAPPRALPQQDVPDLSGTWMIRDTTAWRARVDSAAADTVRDTTTITEVLPLPGGGRLHMHRPANPDSSWPVFRQSLLLQAMAQPVRAFTIAQTDSSITVVNEGGVAYTVYPNGDKTVVPLTDSIDVEIRAKWNDGVLVIEHRPSGGGKFTESYFLADSRQYLRIEVEVDYKISSFPQHSWRSRMYRRVEEDGS
jgi:hypothetical protein